MRFRLHLSPSHASESSNLRICILLRQIYCERMTAYSENWFRKLRFRLRVSEIPTTRSCGISLQWRLVNTAALPGTYPECQERARQFFKMIKTPERHIVH